MHAVFLKEVVKGQYRFTVQSAIRELKLRAQSAADFEAWMNVLQPIAGSVTQEPSDISDATDGMASLSTRAREASSLDMEFDDDDSDPEDGISARPSVAGGGSGSGVAGGSPDSQMSGPPPAGMRGLLEKKSGGKEGKSKLKMLEKWNKRWFVMTPSSSRLAYYKNESEVRIPPSPSCASSCACPLRLGSLYA